MIALIGVVGAARAQGSEMDLPSLSEARAQFDEWLLEDDEAVVSDQSVIMRALGLGRR